MGAAMNPQVTLGMTVSPEKIKRRANMITSIAGIAVSLLVIVLLAASGLVSFDHYGGAYGVSVGTNSAYCSAETAWPALTCESAS
jgi:hypothetical protein